MSPFVAVSGPTNATYGDYADPTDWGAGAFGSGGGLVRIVAGTLALDGKFCRMLRMLATLEAAGLPVEA